MTVIHAFEKAGLGLAPFNYIGCEHRVGPIKWVENGITHESGSPGQPMGTCDYCGQGIAYCCIIKSSDKKTFIVGTTCVGKTHDAGLINEVKREATRMKTENRKAAEKVRISDGMGVYEANRTLFASLPHSRGFKDFKTGEPMTMMDEFDWMYKNAGNAGKLRITRKIEKIVKKAESSK